MKQLFIAVLAAALAPLAAAAQERYAPSSSSAKKGLIDLVATMGY